MVADRKDDDCDGVSMTGYCHLAFMVKAENHADYDEDYPQDTIEHRFTTTIPNNSLGQKHCPDRPCSPGFSLGMELARLAGSVRDFFADWEDVTEGFSYGMRDYE